MVDETRIKEDVYAVIDTMDKALAPLVGELTKVDSDHGIFAFISAMATVLDRLFTKMEVNNKTISDGFRYSVLIALITRRTFKKGDWSDAIIEEFTKEITALEIIYGKP